MAKTANATIGCDAQVNPVVRASCGWLRSAVVTTGNTLNTHTNEPALLVRSRNTRGTWNIDSYAYVQ